ncbi:MAG: hypothetical protein ACETWO_00240 [Candidatus Hadarchaeaceae archaeon]
MNKNMFWVGLIVVITAAAFFAMTWGFRYDWPDFVHVDYGLPFKWGTNTLSTIIGPPEAPWSVDVAGLQLDLIFWLGLIVALAFLRRIIERRQTN